MAINWSLERGGILDLAEVKVKLAFGMADLLVFLDLVLVLAGFRVRLGLGAEVGAGNKRLDC